MELLKVLARVLHLATLHYEYQEDAVDKVE